MKQNYKRLNRHDEKKLEFYGKSKNTLKKSFKWIIAVSGIAVLSVVGIVAFYINLDKKTPEKESGDSLSASHLTSAGACDDTEDLTELSKKELQRESEKEGKISDSLCVAKNSSAEASEIKFYDFSKWNKSCSPELIVVNAGNFLPEETSVKTKVCRGKEIALLASGDLEDMISDAKKQGITLWISSGYRNIKLQKKLFDRQTEREMSKAVISREEAQKRAARVVAMPYASEHNTGLAVDFNGVENNFYTTSEYKWLMDNAHNYGFIERYQKAWQKRTGVIYEPWHFRYVGKEIAPKVKESGLCFEEYVQKNLINQ